MIGGAKESIQRHPFFTKVQTETNLSAFRFNTLFCYLQNLRSLNLKGNFGNGLPNSHLRELQKSRMIFLSRLLTFFLPTFF